MKVLSRPPVWIGLLFLASVVAGSAVSLAGGSSIKAAGPGDASYDLKVVELQYPLLQQSSTGVMRDRSAVGVTLSGSWAGATSYPGNSKCEVTVIDAGGSVVGSQVIEVGSQKAQLSEIGPVAVAVSSVPASASVACSAAEKAPADAGYSLSGVKVTGTADDAKLTGTAMWTTSEAPLLHRCDATFQLTDGTPATYTFEISLGNGDPLNVLLAPKFAGATIESTSCTQA
jgi:hypothetical protein